MPTTPKAIVRLEAQLKTFRELINADPVHELLYHSSYWKQVCACLDVLEDTTLVISAYDALPTTYELKREASSYLNLYGLLQAVFVQQDAIYNLAECLDKTWLEKYKQPGDFFKNYPDIERIRRVRNISVGHPTKRGGGTAYGFIRRNSLTKDCFELETLYADGHGVIESVHIGELIYKQLTWTEAMIKQISPSK